MKMSKDETKVALFIMPRSSNAWRGSEALWITVAGWASAAKHEFGEAWVVTSDRCASPAEVMNYPLTGGSEEAKRVSKFTRLLPTIVVTLMKDIRLWLKSRKHFALHDADRWEGRSVVFVWEHHDIFPGPGKKLADRLKVPFIKYVHAPQVWESAKWAVKRPGWGRMLEKYAEVNSLNQADIVACVSREVSSQLKEIGVDEKRILVSPMAVDPEHFVSLVKSEDLLETYHLKDRFVIGWIGSFRNFHGLDLLIMAFKNLVNTFPDSTLLLVGDGLERKSLEELVVRNDLQGHVIFAGKKSFSQIPLYVALFDIAVVSARSPQGFHYSPLKLREYLAAGRPTLAPRAGEIPEVFQEGEHLLLYEAGDVQSLAAAMIRLRSDGSLRLRLSEKGQMNVLSSGTWSVELKRVMDRLKGTNQQISH
jgi:glycosyltransferase involved in cell wall biosynthesis